MKTTSVWKSGQEFSSTYHNATINTGGAGNFSPKSLLLAGLAGCTGIDVVLILEKMRVPFADLQIETQTEQTDTEPKVFKDIQLTFSITTAEENRDKVKKAIDLSLEKYCGVAAMLQKHSAIHYTLQVKPE
jgi:putative redox protein